eukprot:9127662-Heterocapsa_arctica.AAC.1
MNSEGVQHDAAQGRGLFGATRATPPLPPPAASPSAVAVEATSTMAGGQPPRPIWRAIAKTPPAVRRAPSGAAA